MHLSIYLTSRDRWWDENEYLHEELGQSTHNLQTLHVPLLETPLSVLHLTCPMIKPTCGFVVYGRIVS